MLNSRHADARRRGRRFLRLRATVRDGAGGGAPASPHGRRHRLAHAEVRADEDRMKQTGPQRTPIDADKVAAEFKLAMPFGGTTMNSDSTDRDGPPQAAAETGRPGRHMLWYTRDDGGEGVTTYTYEIGEEARQFTFTHDTAQGIFVLAKPDGTTERFRDNPARYLVVEQDPVTGELRPAVKRGQPTYIYLCREQREP